MKTKLFGVMLLAIITSFSAIKAQGFQPPAEGKAVVYFVRVTTYGYAVSMELFNNDRHIGGFAGPNSMRYECDPGEHLFWASSENLEFVPATLDSGKTYIIIVDVMMGMWKARVGLHPISINDEDLFKRAKTIVMKQKPIVVPEEKLEATNKKFAKLIAEKLKIYDEELKNTELDHLTPEMAIPEESLK